MGKLVLQNLDGMDFVPVRIEEPRLPTAVQLPTITGALDVSDFRDFRINCSKLFAERQNYISGIENSLNQVKRRMRKFNGVQKEHFGLFLKECEWRFNNSDSSSQLSQLTKWVRMYLNYLSRTAPIIILIRKINVYK